MDKQEAKRQQEWMQREREVSELKRFMKASYEVDQRINHQLDSARYTKFTNADQFDKYKAVFEEKHYQAPPVDPIQEAINQAVRELKE